VPDKDYKVYTAHLKDGRKWCSPFIDSSIIFWALSFVDKHKRYIDIISPGDVIFDVGATTGEYTIPAALAAGKKGKIYAFEPNPITFYCMKANASLYGVRVSGFMLALSDVGGKKTKLYTESDGVSGESMIKKYRPGKKIPINVTTETLDNFCHNHNINNIDVLKITVNGYDPKVLAGALKTLPNVHYVLIQTYPDPALESSRILKENGFECREVITYQEKGKDVYNGIVMLFERV